MRQAYPSDFWDLLVIDNNSTGRHEGTWSLRFAWLPSCAPARGRDEAGARTTPETARSRSPGGHHRPGGRRHTGRARLALKAGRTIFVRELALDRRRRRRGRSRLPRRSPRVARGLPRAAGVPARHGPAGPGPGAHGRKLRLPEMGLPAFRAVRHAARPPGHAALRRRGQRDDPAHPLEGAGGLVRARSARPPPDAGFPAHLPVRRAPCVRLGALPRRGPRGVAWQGRQVPDALSGLPCRCKRWQAPGTSSSPRWAARSSCARAQRKRALVRAWRSCGYLYQIARTAIGKL